MGDADSEPTMEEILASIRRIIAEDPNVAAPPLPSAQPKADALAQADEGDMSSFEDDAEATDPLAEDEILELTQAVREDAPILSHETAELTQATLSQLSQMVVRGEEPNPNTLEGMVREMLRPMLKEWLDANLPEIVEAMVSREISRITGGVGR